MVQFFIPPEDLPRGFSYPSSFRLVVQRGLLDWDPWAFLDGAVLTRRFDGLGRRYPTRLLVPFARRVDRDDVACWDLDRAEGTISVIEDFAPSGDEQTDLLESFGDWLKLALNDMVEFED